MDDTIELIKALSPYKVTRGDDLSLLLEEDTTMLKGILIFCLAAVVYGFSVLDTRSAIILSCVALLFLSIFRIVTSFTSLFITLRILTPAEDAHDYNALLQF